MKTTMNLDDDLLEEASALALREGSSLTALIEDGLRLRLQLEQSKHAQELRPEIAVFHGRGGLVAGVDPLTNRALGQAADDYA